MLCMAEAMACEKAAAADGVMVLVAEAVDEDGVDGGERLEGAGWAAVGAAAEGNGEFRY